MTTQADELREERIHHIKIAAACPFMLIAMLLCSPFWGIAVWWGWLTDVWPSRKSCGLIEEAGASTR